jgi:hypothetical protein
MRPLDPLDGPETARETVSPQARQAIHRFGACVVGRSAGKAAETLLLDFHSTRYRAALRVLSDNNRDCFGRRGAMRANHLLFAAALAEALLAKKPGALKAHLAMAAARTPVESFGPLDRAAICAVRSVPDDVAALLGSVPGSAPEAEPVRTVEMVMRRCAPGVPFEISPAGVRAVVATAAFRSVATGEGGK